MNNVSDIRRDPITGIWVIIAEGRAARPVEYRSNEVEHLRANVVCPFCPGHEHLTPPAVYVLPADAATPNGSSWDLRVVPNSFAALQMAASSAIIESPPFESKPAHGRHEVVIETPEHDLGMEKYDPARMIKVLTVYRNRIRALSEDPTIRYVQLFRNYGAFGGASLRHPHAQLLALPLLPPDIEGEMQRSLDYRAQMNCSLFDDVIAREMDSRLRWLTETLECVAFVPFAARFPHECRILPKRDAPDFAQVGDEVISDLAHVVSKLLRGLTTGLGDFPFNLILRYAPHGRHPESDRLLHTYRWRMEIIPRMSPVAGFEWGSGVQINSVAPERSAQMIRDWMDASPL